MRSSRQILVLALVSIVALFACRSKQDGSIEGSIVPPGTPARITALQDGKEMLTVPAGGQDGKFKLVLAAGNYSINVSVPGSPHPLRFDGISVRPGEMTVLPPIQLMPSSGTGVLSGKVTPPRPGARITLMYEGKERAAVQTDHDGRYEFKELAAGSYVVQANAPGHADDAVPVVITDNQKTEQNAVLLPIASVNGVDWTSGKIRATGIGLPPQNAANKTVSREMAKRAALADAERNLLRTIEQIHIDADRDVKAAMGNKKVERKIQGFIKGHTIVSERELDDGRYEVILELPLSGPSGLSRYIAE